MSDSSTSRSSRSPGRAPTGRRRAPADREPLAERWSDVLDSARPVSPIAGRYVVLAPHPDDEVLSVGGLIAHLVAVGADVTVVAVTDGGNAYPGLVDHDELAAVRRRERLAALDRLGVSEDHLVSMGRRDGSVAECEDELVEQICAVSDPATTLVAPWTHDVHPDHEATGRAASRAASRVGCSVWFSLFWAWHHAPPSALDRVDMVAVELGSAVRRSKQSALDCHATQLRPVGVSPVLDDIALEPAHWSAEYFVVAPPPMPTRDRRATRDGVTP